MQDRTRILIITAALCLASISFGCSANVSPIPGFGVGFSAAPDEFGVRMQVDPLTFGCEVAKAISWNFMENGLCKEGFVETSDTAEPRPLATVGQGEFYHDEDNFIGYRYRQDDGQTIVLLEEDMVARLE